MAACHEPFELAIIILVVTFIFMPSALVSASLVLLAIAKSSADKIMTQMNLFISTSSLASLMSILVNGIRIRHYYLISKAIEQQETTSWVYIRSACHICWMSSQFVASACILSIFLMQTFDAQSFSRGLTDAYGKFYKAIALCIWVLGIMIGLCIFFVNFPTVVKAQTMLFCIIATVTLLYVCFTIFAEKSDQSLTDEIGNQESTDGSPVQHGSNNASDSIGIKLETAGNDAFIAENKELALERSASFKRVLFFSFCVFLGGFFQFLQFTLEATSCVLSLWFKGLASLCLQCYLAFSPVVFIFASPSLKLSVIGLLQRGRIQPTTA